MKRLYLKYSCFLCVSCYLDISLIGDKKPLFNHLFSKLQAIQSKWEVLSRLLDFTITEKPNDDQTNLSQVLDSWLNTKGNMVLYIESFGG